MINTSTGNPRVVLDRYDSRRKVNILQKNESSVSRINSSRKFDVIASKVRTRNESIFKSQVSINRSSNISPSDGTPKHTSPRRSSARNRKIAADLDAPSFLQSSSKACSVLLIDILRTNKMIKKQNKSGASGFSFNLNIGCHELQSSVFQTRGIEKQNKVTADKNQRNPVQKEVKIILKRCDAGFSNESIKALVNYAGDSNYSNVSSNEMPMRTKEKGRLTRNGESSNGWCPKVVLKRCDEVTLFGENTVRKPLVERSFSCKAVLSSSDLNIANGLGIKTQPSTIFKTQYNVKTQHEISCSEHLINCMKITPMIVLEKCDAKAWNANDKASVDLYETSNHDCLFYPEVLVETETEVDFEFEFRGKDEGYSVYRNQASQINENNVTQAISQNSSFENSELNPDSSTEFATSLSKYRWNEKSHLQSGLNTSNEEKPFACEFCPARFTVKWSAKRHKISVHGGKEAGGDKLNKSSYLPSDETTHVKDRPFVCEHCPDASFKQKVELKNCMRTHIAGRSFPCDHCPARFMFKQTLTDHPLTHRTEKPFSCEYCPARFKILSRLKYHQLTHSQEKSFSCENCAARFKRRAALNRHKIIHTEAKFSCYHCSSRFWKLEALQKHLWRNRKQIQETQLFTTEQLSLLQTAFFNHENFPRI